MILAYKIGDQPCFVGPPADETWAWEIDSLPASKISRIPIVETRFAK